MVITAHDSEQIDFNRISTWIRLRRVAGWVIRFTENVSVKKEDRQSGELTANDLKSAEQLVLKEVQKECFQEELLKLKNGGVLPSSNRLSMLCPFVDATGLMKVGGRLNRLEIPPEVKHPVILPRTHRVTRMLVEWMHRRNGHVGPDHTLSLVRGKYWVMSGRIVVNQVLRQCFFCRVRRAKQQFPFMADLPTCRAAVDQPPFCHCGVDLFGPVYIKQGRKRLKRWIVLFTCMTIRCVHLEVVEATDTDSFINAVQRFVNRRGSPTHVYSDNGTNFRGATTELKEFILKLDKDAITNFASMNQILWSFNPPAAPHMGGA